MANAEPTECCPGHPAIVATGDSHHEEEARVRYVVCTRCGCRGPEFYENMVSMELEAIKAWERRGGK
jgi:hypothetical protein